MIDQSKQEVFSRRAIILGGCQALLLSTLVSRMYYLEIFSNRHYAKLSDRNRIHARLTVPLRGNIIDRKGKIIASNHNVYQAMMIRDDADDWRKVLTEAAQFLALSDEAVEQVAKVIIRKPRFMPVIIKDNLTWAEVSALELHQIDLPGVYVEEGRNRYYPYPLQTCHILGYVAAPSEKDLDGDPLLELPGVKIGKSGIEKAFELQMRGQPGVLEVEVNAHRRVVRELSTSESVAGQQLQLTLDLNLQQTIHARLEQEKSAAAVVLNVKTGGVLAYCSVPGYDNNLFVNGIPKKEWELLRDDPYHSLINKPIAGQYAPGSTFKMIVGLAALAEGGINEHTSVHCGGYVQLGSHKFHCWHKEGHGSVNLSSGIAYSCDVYFYHIASLVGIDAIARMSRLFGLGDVTGIELPGEKKGLVPSRSWKSGVLGHKWSLGETYNAGIGQGYMLTTLMQLAVMSARLASGKKVTPHLVQAPQGSFEDLGIKPEHLKLVQEGMERVINQPGGTAYRSRLNQDDYQMAGKTGSCQVRRITARERELGQTSTANRPWHHREHALFVCYAPIHDPLYAAAVLVEHGVSGSKAAAPIGRDIMIAAQQILQEEV